MRTYSHTAEQSQGTAEARHQQAAHGPAKRHGNRKAAAARNGPTPRSMLNPNSPSYDASDGPWHQQGKDESARIRVENIIRSDIDTELLEILELYCELLLARIGLLEAKECDPGLEEAVKSVIYAAPRTEIKELQQARALLVEKYGKDFALQAMENSDSRVSERVVKKLEVKPPDPVLVDLYLKEIAKTYGVQWPKKNAEQDNNNDGDDDDDDDDTPSGGQAIKLAEEPLTTAELTQATPPRSLGPKSPISVAPPSPSTENASPKIKLPGPPELKPGPRMSGLKKSAAVDAKSNASTAEPGGNKGAPPGKVPDVDELAKRFAALKRG